MISALVSVHELPTLVMLGQKLGGRVVRPPIGLKKKALTETSLGTATAPTIPAGQMSVI